MSTELIIIILGAILMLLAIVDSVNIKGSSLNLMSPVVRIPLGITGFLLIIYGGYSYGAINLQGQIEQPVTGNKLEPVLPINKVQVLSPIKGDVVDCRILTMGVYPDAHDKDIWVLLKPSDGKYYPQSDHTNTSYKRNGEWQVISRFGGDKGESYDLIVYETDTATSDYFSSVIEEWKKIESYPGLQLEDIPSGAVEVDRIVVSLRDNCRGVF